MSEIIGIASFSVFGLWWVVAPQSVISFYTWFQGKPLAPAPKPLGIRIAGLLWIALVACVVYSWSKGRPAP